MSDVIISIRDLSKSFGNHEVLKKIDIDVCAGEIICIVGSSGSGKSTLLRCINGLESIDSGEILLQGQVISGETKDLHRIRQRQEIR